MANFKAVIGRTVSAPMNWDCIKSYSGICEISDTKRLTRIKEEDPQPQDSILSLKCGTNPAFNMLASNLASFNNAIVNVYPKVTNEEGVEVEDKSKKPETFFKDKVNIVIANGKITGITNA